MALKGIVMTAFGEGRWIHHNVGESLNIIRTAAVSEILDFQERAVADLSIKPLAFNIPQHEDEEIYNVQFDEAFRLYSQLEALHSPPADVPHQPKSTQNSQSLSNNKVFLVHGHDEAARESVARFSKSLP